MEKSQEDGISVWFWSRSDVTVPDEVRKGEKWISPNLGWGLPGAKFPVNGCDYERHFNAHQIIFDLTLCVSCF